MRCSARVVIARPCCSRSAAVSSAEQFRRVLRQADDPARDTVVLLTADHGMQAAVPGCSGDWDAALTEAGVPYRDEAYGFIYLGV